MSSSEETIPLGEIADVKLGKMLDRQKHRTGKKMSYLRNVNVRWGRIETDDLEKMYFDEDEQDRFGLVAGDVLVCEGGEPGRAAVWNGSIPALKYQKALHRVRFRVPFDPRFLVYFLERLASAGGLERRFTGSTIKHFTREAFLQLPLPRTDLGEQRRLLSEIEKQFTRLDAGVAALRRAQANLKRYRAAILKAACEGRLVPTDISLAGTRSVPDETGVDVVDRCLAQHRRRWSGRSEYKPPGMPDVEDLPSLPPGWAWSTLAALAELKGGITKDQKRTHAVPARSVPYLRVANVQRGYIDLTEVKDIEATEADIRELALRRGDILFNEGGDRDKLGRGWVWNDELPECIHQNHVFRARVFDTALQPKFISWYANTFGQKFFFDEGKHTTNLASISMAKLKALPVPVPPPAEQHRIVAEVERRLSVVDELDAVVTANLQRAARLRQSILQRAFSGGLVPSKASD
jgi:type I restriction enzyme S subunit